MRDRSPLEWAILPVKRYAQFWGRAPRAEYWWFTGASLMITLMGDATDWAIGSEAGIFDWALSLAFLIPGIAVTVRRLHDTDRSGWWIFSMVVPAAMMAFEVVQADLAGLPDDADPGALLMGGVILFFFGAVALLIFSLQRGTNGPNRYGADPYESEAAPVDNLARS